MDYYLCCASIINWKLKPQSNIPHIYLFLTLSFENKYIKYQNFRFKASTQYLFVSVSVALYQKEEEEEMALTNLILTVAGVSAVILLLRSDVKQSATIFRRNVKHIRHWLEEESASASKYTPLFISLSIYQYDLCIFDFCSYWVPLIGPIN